MSRHLHSLSCLCLIGVSTLVAAQEPADPADSLCPPGYKLDIPKPVKPTGNDKSTHIDADSATIDSQAVTRFSGSVVARQGNKQLSADQVTYDRRTDQTEAQGNVVFTTADTRVKGDRATMNLQTNQGKVENAEYQTATVNGRGKAEVINIKSQHELSLEGATYTTCPRDHVAWQIRADKINLNSENHQGSARSVVLDIAHVPVLYLPYIRFPFGEERLSGFLYPAFSVSQSSGTEIATPYYWNIAPNMDATITPHNMSKRGLMLENTFRYLTPNSHGQVELDHIGQDTVYGRSRTKFDWLHAGKPGAGWSSTVDYHYVSDDQYLSDFTSSLTSTATTTSLNRQGTLTYNQQSYAFTTSLQDHQTISGTEPYQRLPQLAFNTRLSKHDNSWNYDFNSEFVNFAHRDPNKVVGQRVKLSPYIAYPVVKDAGYFKPKLTLNYLQYNLDHTTGTQPRQPDVSVPVFSLDSGVYLERGTSFGGTRLLQTLEPRLFYLYAPYRDQSLLPVFDTALTSFSQSLLFSENRFSGNDRIGDANQATVAITTRLYRQDNGAELFNATVGQIFYFRDREVVVPGQSVDTKTRSNYIGNVSFTPNPNWSLDGDWQYNPETRHTEVGNIRLQNRPGKGRVVNLEYRFTRDQLRTQGASFAWRINPRWQALGGSQYDLLNKHRLQNFIGLGYESCCWGARLVWGERFDRLVNNDPNEPRYEHALYLEFQLKGLSSLGSGKDIDTLLKNGILGYSQ